MITWVPSTYLTVEKIINISIYLLRHQSLLLSAIKSLYFKNTLYLVLYSAVVDGKCDKFISFMPSISYILKAVIKIGCIILILLISKETSEFSFSNENMNPVAQHPDTPPVHEVAEKVPLSIEDPSMSSRKKTSVGNISNFENDINDPFVQKITRVSDDEENMIELNTLSKKNKFLWFQIGKDESGEERFRTLHRKKYNPYDFDEHENLHTNQYEDKIINKLGAKVTNVKTEETKLEAPDPKVEESLKHQPDHEEDFKKSSFLADQETPNESPANNDISARMEISDGETLKKPVADAEKSQVTESQLSQSDTKPKPHKKVTQEEDESFIKKEKKYRGRKVEDSLMLEFAHNRPDSRILWLNYPDYRRTDDYRLIDEAAERTLITSREYGFVNTDTDSMKAAGRLITYVENNKIGEFQCNLKGSIKTGLAFYM